MSLITLFTAPKPFTDPHIAIIQHNAIKSWTLLPDVDIILLGDEEGLEDKAGELGLKHIPDVALSQGGTPLISSMFQLARDASEGDLLCIINADILLMSDFVEAARDAGKLRDKFVLLSQRWDMDVANPLFFSEGWADRLR
jgi:hypothetical protein